MLETYDRLVAKCETINRLNARHIALYSSLTPQEVIELHAGLVADESYWQRPEMSNPFLDRTKFREVTQRWVQDLFDYHNLSAKPAVEPYFREEIHPAITRFSDARGPAGKTLIICLCGNGHIPMMPTPSFLQAFDASKIDVVIVRDFQRQGYRLGIAGIGETIEESWERLPKIVDAAAYDSFSFVGISSGGLPSVFFSLASGARAVMAVGSNLPTDPRWNRRDGVTGEDLLRELIATGTRPARTILVFGKQSADRPAAEAIASLLPATLCEITHPVFEVGHSALFPLLQQSRLTEFLYEQLDLPT